MSPAPTRTVPGSPETLLVAEVDAADADGVVDAGLDFVREVHAATNNRHSNTVECFIIPQGFDVNRFMGLRVQAAFLPAFSFAHLAR